MFKRCLQNACEKNIPLEMDSCIVCCQSSEDVFQHISTASSEWNEWNIQRIIEKHLWWWYLRPKCSNELDQWICCECWHELSTFHSFYIKVEMKNKLNNQIFCMVRTVEDQLMPAEIKVEELNHDNFSILSENVMHLEKPKRGRKKKHIDKPERIQIEELPFAQVKFENEGAGPRETNTESNVDFCVNDEIGSVDWEQCFLNESDGSTEEEKTQDVLENNELDLLKMKKAKAKLKIKAKPITKYRKKYTKSKKEKKVKVEKSNLNSNATQTMRKNDKFIADNQFQLSCCICIVSLNNFNDLKNHFRKEHNILGYAMCCNKKFYKRGVLVDHLNVHKDPEYFKCLQCNKSLSTRRSYEKHMETHQLNETRQNLFTCEKCDKSFIKKPVYDRHVLTHVPEEERNFQCSMCDKKFASEYLRKQHCSLTHSKKYAKICDICGKLLRDSFSFIRHMAEHKGETPAKVECDICGAQLTNKYRLNRHKKMMHTEENQQEQICPYCSKVSPNLNAHRHHVKYTHTLERKHACNMCDKKFRRPLELKEHLSTHTGEPLYTCPHCPRTFISSANMHKHRKLTHRKEWEESRMKKEAKALAGKKFLKSLNATQNDVTYPELGILDPGTESVPNLSSIFC